MNKLYTYVKRGWVFALPIIPILGWYFFNEQVYEAHLLGCTLAFAYGVTVAVTTSLFRLKIIKLVILSLLIGMLACIYPILELIYFMGIFAILGFLFSLLSGKWKWCLLYFFVGVLLPIVVDLLISLISILISNGHLHTGCPASAGYLTGNLIAFCLITYLPILGLIGLDIGVNAIRSKYGLQT